MFKKIKQLFSADSSQTRVSKLAQYDLSDRPLTKALLFWSAKRGDEAEANLPSSLGKIRSFEESNTLEGMIDGALISESCALVVSALKDIGRNFLFPWEPIPRDMPLLLTFAFYVYCGLHDHIAEEGYSPDVEKGLVGLGGMLVFQRDTEETLVTISNGLRLFQAIVSKEPERPTWATRLTGLLRTYVAQWVNTDTNSDEKELTHEFGLILSSLLSVAH